MKTLVRKLWRLQPTKLRQLELSLLGRFLTQPLEAQRPLLPGAAIVAGFLGTTSGLGEGARLQRNLLQQAGVKVYGANVSRFAVMEDFEAGPLWPEDAPPGGIVIFHVNPDLLNLTLRAIGKARLQKRRIVGFWAWELEVIPCAWRVALRSVDEVWVPSSFIADAIRKAVPDAKVHVVPLTVDAATQPIVPQRDPLPQFQGRPVVLFAYDVRSTLARKNPEAVIAAFLKATAQDKNPVLVLKVTAEAAWPEAKARLERATAGHANIHVIRDVMPGAAMKDLIARADVILSLHRSEGFGLLLAEGMAAGKPVIATGWSGNLDFMPEDGCVRVPSRLVPVVDPQNAYNRYNASWAEPDVDFAAEQLRRLLADPAERQRLGQAARAHALQFFAPETWLKKLPQSFWDSLTPAARGSFQA